MIKFWKHPSGEIFPWTEALEARGDGTVLEEGQSEVVITIADVPINDVTLKVHKAKAGVKGEVK